MESLKEDFSRYGARGLALLFCLATGAAYIAAKASAELVLGGHWHLSLWLLLALTIAMTSARHPIMFWGNKTAVSVSEVLIFLAVMVLGPAQGALLAAVDMLLVSRRLKLKLSFYLFNSSNIVLSVYLAGKLYYVLSSQMPVRPEFFGGFGGELITRAGPLVALAVSDYLLQLIGVVLLSYSTGLINIADRMKGTFPWEPVTFLAAATVAGLVHHVYSEHGLFTTALTMLLVMPIPVIIYYTFKAYRDKLGEQEKHYSEITSIYDSILEMLAMAIDAKDDVTHDHIQRVKHFARRMGDLVGLSDREIEALKAGALLHDIGKIGVPSYILNKPGKLTEHEFEQMKMHTIIGADMLSNIDFRYPVVPIVRHHHERWDGRGYPDGLAGDAIPITARILTLVDNYDALRSDRPYKKGMSKDEALLYIKDNAGVFFDPTLVQLFLGVIDQLEEEAACFKPPEASRRSTTGPIANSFAAPAAGFATSVDRATAALYSIAETNQRVTALYEMSRTLASNLSVEDTVAILGNRLSKLVPFTTCAITLFDPTSSEYEFAYVVGRYADQLLQTRRPAEAGVIGWVITNQTAMYNTNPVLDLGFLGSDVARSYSTVMVCPIVKNKEVLGAIALYSADLEAYGSDHINLMECVAQAAGDAIYNAKVFEEASRNALTDAATGLPNMRGITIRFEQEIARLESDSSIALVLINFNRFNDSSYDANDHLIACLAETIKHETRETDLLGRVTASSFCLLIRERDQEEVDELAQGIIEAIRLNEATRHVIATVGSAVAPRNGEDLESLLRSAQLECIAACKDLSPIGTANALKDPVLA